MLLNLIIVIRMQRPDMLPCISLYIFPLSVLLLSLVDVNEEVNEKLNDGNKTQKGERMAGNKEKVWLMVE